MRAYYQGRTYLVEYTDSDAHCFTAHTHAPQGVVAGKGSFVFDSATGDMIGARGSAAKHGGDIEWLAFSQDAQDYGRGQLMREGVAVNPFDFGAHMPEFAVNPKKGKDPKGRRIELVHTPDQWTTLRPGVRGYVAFVDDTGTIFVDWDDGQRLGLVPGTDHFQYLTETNPAPVSRISRTRGVKTMRGPYDARRGYQPWITRRGKLGTGFLTSMSKADRRKSLDRCVAEYGYRSCLGSIMALERAKRGPRGTGEGVGVKYAKKLTESREYLKKKFGGVGSFGPQKKERRLAAANPSQFQEISLTEIKKGLDLDPDQERLLDRLVMVARNDGDAYRASDPRAAVEQAFRNIQQADAEYLKENYELGVRGEAIRLVKKRWKSSNPMPNPCFGLHVHGPEVGPVLRQLQGNPGAKEHLDMAQQLSTQINGGLSRIDDLLSEAHDEIYDDDDPRVTEEATEKMHEAIGILRRMIREIAHYRVEVQYAKPTQAQLASLPKYHVPRLEALLRDLTATASACDTCTRIPQVGRYAFYSQPRRKVPKGRIPMRATGKKKKTKPARKKATKKKATKKKATKKKAR